MPSDGHVLMVVNTYAPDDPRVIFSASSLVANNYQVLLLGAARQKNDEEVLANQSERNVPIQLIPHITTLTGLLHIPGYFLRGRLPETVTTSAGRTTVLSLLLFNLWILRIGLFRPVDVIHCHDLSPLPGCWLLSVLKRCPLIYDIHEDVSSMYGGRKGQLMTRLERLLVPRTDYVIAAGQRLADAMAQRGAKRVVHIGNWKPLADYDISDQEIQALRQKWSIPSDALVVSFLGTLDKNRELPALFEAIVAMPDVYLLIAGRGDYRELVIEYAQTHERIIWLDWVPLDDLPLYTVAADVLYYCRSETMPGGSYELAPAPNKLYEAFAAGLPVIARRGVGEIGEILETIPAGVLLDDVTPQTVQQALETLQQPEVYAEKQAVAYAARERYNWSRAEELLDAVYDELLAPL